MPDIRQGPVAGTTKDSSRKPVDGIAKVGQRAMRKRGVVCPMATSVKVNKDNGFTVFA